MSISVNARLITFEGIDGCGKSTQARSLVDRLNAFDVPTILVREPGGTRISESIRQILLNKDMNELRERTEALLMAASRAQLTKEVIIPNLEQNKWVVADRYSDSTLAYQGGGRNIKLDWLLDLNSFATYELFPDITFFVDIRPEIGLQRRGVTPDRIENEGLDFQVKVRNAYLELVRRFPSRFVAVDGHQSIDDLHNTIWSEITRRHFLKS